MATLNVPHPVPTPEEDAQALRKACQGWGTDEKGVIEVIAHRNADQLRLIKLAYERLYNENLIKRLESELSGDFERAVYRWMHPPTEREALLAHVAVTESDHRVIVETACINSTNELLVVKKAYHALYKRSLEEDVASHTSGDMRKFLVALLGTYRYDGPDVNIRLAESEAKILHDAIKEKVFSHEEVIRILGTRSKAQLVATFNRYKDEFGVSITKDLSGKTSDDFVAALRVAVRCIVAPKKYYEKLLQSATSNPGYEDALTRVIVTRAEKDLKEIKELFEHRTNALLEQAISNKASGDYRKFLLALLGK
uniref:Annexin4 n=1 Tax=Albuca bracteata TaxID=82047 RepID=A0A0A1ETK5_ALBBR|nr:annexin4 [Albuca bracteata]